MDINEAFPASLGANVVSAITTADGKEVARVEWIEKNTLGFIANGKVVAGVTIIGKTSLEDMLMILEGLVNIGLAQIGLENLPQAKNKDHLN